jgi:hypothetical protein
MGADNPRVLKARAGLAGYDRMRRRRRCRMAPGMAAEASPALAGRGAADYFNSASIRRAFSAAVGHEHDMVAGLGDCSGARRAATVARPRLPGPGDHAGIHNSGRWEHIDIGAIEEGIWVAYAPRRIGCAAPWPQDRQRRRARKPSSVVRIAVGWC